MNAEQFIKDYTNHCSNEMVFDDGSGSHLYEPWITPDQALRAVEIAREEMIDKACAWLSNVSLEDMTYKYNDFDTSEGWYKFIEDFKKYMEE